MRRGRRFDRASYRQDAFDVGLDASFLCRVGGGHDYFWDYFWMRILAYALALPILASGINRVRPTACT